MLPRASEELRNQKAANWGDPYANMMPISICCRHMTQHGV